LAGVLSAATPGRRLSSPRSRTIATRVPTRIALRRSGLSARREGVASARGRPGAHRSSPFRDVSRPVRAAAILGHLSRLSVHRAETRGSARRAPGSVALTVTTARRAPGAGRAEWSTFAAHPWSLINDHRGHPAVSRGLSSRPFRRSARCAVPRGVGIGLADRLRMDQRNVREQQQDGGVPCKPEASDAPTSRRRGGGSIGTQDCSRVLPEGCPLLTASELAFAMRTSRRAVSAMAERAQLSGVIRIGRRLVVRRGSRLPRLVEKRRALPAGEIKFSLGDDSADLAAAPRERF
jgi:hypothetical protein